MVCEAQHTCSANPVLVPKIRVLGGPLYGWGRQRNALNRGRNARVHVSGLLVCPAGVSGSLMRRCFDSLLYIHVRSVSRLVVSYAIMGHAAAGGQAMCTMAMMWGSTSVFRHVVPSPLRFFSLLTSFQHVRPLREPVLAEALGVLPSSARASAHLARTSARPIFPDRAGTDSRSHVPRVD